MLAAIDTPCVYLILYSQPQRVKVFMTSYYCSASQEAQKIFPAKYPIEKESSGAKVGSWPPIV